MIPGRGAAGAARIENVLQIGFFLAPHDGAARCRERAG
jgi:hypothetical protein